MDLVSCGKKVVVLMEHVNPNGKPKIVEKCSLPLTGAGVVSTIITDLVNKEFIHILNGSFRLFLILSIKN